MRNLLLSLLTHVVALAGFTLPSMATDLWPTIKPAIKADAALEQKISAKLASMSIEEKVGQLVMAEIGSISPSDVRKFNIGGILNGGGSWPTKTPGSDVKSWLAMAESFYRESSKSSTAIPVIWGTDAVHGHNNVYGATVFPHNIGLGAANNPGLMRDIGIVTAREVAVTGIDWVFAPTVAVTTDLRWGRSYESYSADPDIVSALAKELILGLQGHPALNNFLTEEKVVTTVKHFVGDGGTKYGTGRDSRLDQGDTQVSEAELVNIHGKPYFYAIGAGAQTVMASFSSWNGEKMHGSKYLLTDVLKNKMGFDGFVVGDWNGHEQVPGCNVKSCVQSVNAGVDMMMVPTDWRMFLENTIAAVKSGEITTERLDDATRRILRVKYRSGLMDGVAPSKRLLGGSENMLGHKDHREIARQAVRESLVLLKNENALPVKTGRVFIGGPAADSVRFQAGGWTMDWQGRNVSENRYGGFTLVADGLKSAVKKSPAKIVTNADKLEAGDTAILIIGETPYAEFEGDLDTTDFTKVPTGLTGQIESLNEKGVKTVLIFLTGRPLGVDQLIDAADAFVVAWLPGSEGQGVADVLVADKKGDINANFKGVLPFDWPFNSNNATNNETKRYSIGYGLTY